MKALLIDAKDSFVYIIDQYLQTLNIKTTVVRENKLNIEQIEQYDFIVLGPGPGHPLDVCYIDIINKYKDKKPILGVCLGHQAIWIAFGGKVTHAQQPMHGKVVDIKNNQKYLFKNFSAITSVCRYHSLIASREQMANDMEVLAYDEQDNAIMAVRHTKYPIASLQFHPESIGTKNGIEIIKNFIEEFCY